jgi:hypothetical protein
LWIAGEVRVFRELSHEQLIGRRDVLVRERDAVEQQHKALGERAQIVLRVGTEDDLPGRLAPGFIGT